MQGTQRADAIVYPAHGMAFSPQKKRGFILVAAAARKWGRRGGRVRASL